MKKLVLGVGVYEKGKYSCKKESIQTREYTLWHNMLERCYSPSYQKKYPSYVGCTVSDNFKNFQYFAEWCNNQVGFSEKDYHLDKDLLSKHNKLYSENTCVFVPRELNIFLTKCNSIRGDCLIGVTYYKKDGKYGARVSTYTGSKKSKFLGLFNSQQEAFEAYKSAKEGMLKRLLLKYEGCLDDRVIQSLSAYSVDTTD